MRCLASILVAGGLLALICGCESVDARVARHAATFGQLGPDVQARLRTGEVARGDTFDMVVIAAGEPQHANSITTSGGRTRTTWTYTKKVRRSVGTQNVKYSARQGTLTYEEVMRVDEFVLREVVFMDGRVVSVHDPVREARALAALAQP